MVLGMESNTSNGNEMNTEFFTTRTDRDARFNQFAHMGFSRVSGDTLHTVLDNGDHAWVSRVNVPPCGKYPLGAYALRFS
jgi:hypothetical protein